MQTFKFVRRSHGIAKASGNPYDIVEVSDGLSSFPMSIVDGLGDELENHLKKGDEFKAEVYVENSFEGLRGTITKIEL